ncbi:MAG: THUMP domain-containing protein [Bacteroidales bacterium]|nr:THUMP domain-containing protein [Bacteroidales bacterium]MCM1146989.1 THUMP domain-containing protein [Bacteroidales bacterium]MCM1205878.1 THUMP domain-containing protein [Bacillota bacterium]MCM1509881.1 THUMP domain-containing protein [Clostridium sp.]
MEFEMIAKTFMGLENVLAKELTELGAGNVRTGCRMVSFTGDKEMMYRANFQLHTAIRILKPIKQFKAASADEVYEGVKSVDWSEYMTERSTFSVDSVVYSAEFRNSRFVTYKVKDAIVDQFRERNGHRPNISVANPDLRLNIHIAENECTLSLDSSGESLHRRGYRQEQVEAPLNEVLAAGMILMTGWKGETDFIDPMCGSGTLLVEAALIAQNMAPGLFRKEYAFEKWADFDKDLFDEIYNDDSHEREFEHKIIGYDCDIKAVNTARQNVKAAGLTRCIEVECADFKDFQQPEQPAIIVTNPPYGERISTQNLLGTYKMIGERLKHQFQGNEAWILSYKEECFEAIGLKPSQKVPVYNGSLECEFRKYSIFGGKFSEFRKEGGDVKTDEDRKYNAEKRYVKGNRDFKDGLGGDDVREREKALERQYKARRFGNGEEDDDEDIRSFHFHSLDHRLGREERRDRRDRGEYRDRKPYGRDGDRRRDARGDRNRDGRRFDRDGNGKRKDFDRNGSRRNDKGYGDRKPARPRREGSGRGFADRKKMFGKD